MRDLKIIARYLGPYKRDFILAAVCMLFEGTLELLIPYLTAGLIDEGIVAGEHDLDVALAQDRKAKSLEGKAKALAKRGMVLLGARDHASSPPPEESRASASGASSS